MDFAAQISTALIALTGIVALIYTHFQLRHSRQQSRLQHLLTFLHDFEHDPMAGYRKSVAEERLRGAQEPTVIWSIVDFFETIGMLVRRGYLDEYDVWHSFAFWIFNVYADVRDAIEQETKNDPTYYGDFRDLVERIRKVEQREGGKEDRPSKEDVLEFWKEESQIVAGTPTKKHKSTVTPKKFKATP